mmetsp:Transcript_22586/g.38600  ORF Transcript_22586/g.38600 Transcript_22586/m.38600 type:complete len:218 (-) Transcript_22586:516-1169(-)
MRFREIQVSLREDCSAGIMIKGNRTMESSARDGKMISAVSSRPSRAYRVKMMPATTMGVRLMMVKLANRRFCCFLKHSISFPRRSNSFSENRCSQAITFTMRMPCRHSSMPLTRSSAWPLLWRLYLNIRAMTLLFTGTRTAMRKTPSSEGHPNWMYSSTQATTNCMGELQIKCKKKAQSCSRWASLLIIVTRRPLWNSGRSCVELLRCRDLRYRLTI